MLLGTLEHAQSFRLDLLAKTGVEAGAGHDIGFNAEDGGNLLLNVNEFDQAETRVVRVEEQIDVAVSSSLLAGDRAEKIQLCDTGPVKVGLMRT